ncbi:MAG: hypothetical protein U1E52_12285 [Geminicoccaceae bacterium]
MVALEQARRIVLARFRDRMDRMAALLAGISAPSEHTVAQAAEAQEGSGISRGAVGTLESGAPRRRTG